MIIYNPLRITYFLLRATKNLSQIFFGNHQLVHYQRSIYQNLMEIFSICTHFVINSSLWYTEILLHNTCYITFKKAIFFSFNKFRIPVFTYSFCQHFSGEHCGNQDPCGSRSCKFYIVFYRFSYSDLVTRNLFKSNVSQESVLTFDMLLK